MNITTAGTTFFLALVAILVVCRLVSWLGACWGAARVAGEPGPIAARVGILMTGRGLMQLMPVLVGLVTTVMTAPLLTWYERRAQRNGELPASDVPEIADNVAIG